MTKDSTTWSARITPVVKDYLQVKKGLSAGQCLVEYYKILKREEPLQLQQEKEELLKRVAQIEQKVTQLKAQSNTNWHECNTIFEQLSQQKELFDIQNPNSWTKTQIKRRLEIAEIYDISVDQFIQHYQNNGGIHE